MEITVKVMIVRKQPIPGGNKKLYSGNVARKDGESDIVKIWSTKDYPVGKEALILADARLDTLNDVAGS